MEALAFRPSPWSWPYFVASAITLGMALLVYSRGRGAVKRSFFGCMVSVGMSLAAMGVVFLSANAHTATWAARVSQAVVMWMPPFGLEFARALGGWRLVHFRRAAWTATPILGLLSVATPWVFSGARASPYGFVPTPGPLYPLALAQLALAGLVPVVFMAARRGERRARERDQLFVMAVASGIGTGAFVDILPLFGLDAPPIGWLSLLCAAAGLLLAIVRHRLLELQLALLRSLLWLALTAAGAAPFAALAALVGTRFAGEGALELPVFFAALVVGMRVYLVTLQPRIEHLVGRRRRDIEAELKQLADQAGTLQTTEALGRAIDRFLAALDRRLAALVVVDPTGRPRVALSAWGSVPAPARSSPLLVELLHVRGIIARGRASGPAQTEIERACVRWGAEYLGPLVEGEQLLGLIAMGPKQGGGLADAVELEALDRMCVTVTAALASARLYERLQALSNELEQKAAARSASLAKTLRDLRGAEAKLVESEKLASLGQIVSGVAADLSAEVRTVFDGAAALRAHAQVLVQAGEQVRASAPALVAPGFDEMARDVGPLLDAVSEGARRAYAITQDLSGFALTEGAEAPRQPRQPAHLAALIDSTLTLCTRHLADVGVVRDYDETLPEIPVEVGPLGQVILNLVLNAVQAMRGSGTLTLSTRRHAEEAELSVADTGPGIPPEILPRIFEPFFSTKGPTTGTGLGLSISYGIVKRHGGRIAVESTPGTGTVFRVHLPLVGPEAPVEPS